MVLPAFLSERKLSLSFHLDANHFSFFLHATGDFEAATPMLELRGSSQSKFMCGLGGTAWDEKFLPPTESLLIFTARSYEDLFSWHWNPGLDGLVWGWDSLLPSYPFWIVIHYMCMWDQPIPHLHPSYQTGWM